MNYYAHFGQKKKLLRSFKVYISTVKFYIGFTVLPKSGSVNPDRWCNKMFSTPIKMYTSIIFSFPLIWRFLNRVFVSGRSTIAVRKTNDCKLGISQNHHKVKCMHIQNLCPQLKN